MEQNTDAQVASRGGFFHCCVDPIKVRQKLTYDKDAPISNIIRADPGPVGGLLLTQRSSQSAQVAKGSNRSPFSSILVALFPAKTILRV